MSNFNSESNIREINATFYIDVNCHRCLTPTRDSNNIVSALVYKHVDVKNHALTYICIVLACTYQ